MLKLQGNLELFPSIIAGSRFFSSQALGGQNFDLTAISAFGTSRQSQLHHKSDILSVLSGQLYFYLLYREQKGQGLNSSRWIDFFPREHPCEQYVLQFVAILCDVGEGVFVEHFDEFHQGFSENTGEMASGCNDTFVL